MARSASSNRRAATFRGDDATRRTTVRSVVSTSVVIAVDRARSIPSNGLQHGEMLAFVAETYSDGVQRNSDSEKAR